MSLKLYSPSTESEVTPISVPYEVKKEGNTSPRIAGSKLTVIELAPASHQSWDSTKFEGLIVTLSLYVATVLRGSII